MIFFSKGDHPGAAMQIPESTWRPELPLCVTRVSVSANGGDRFFLNAHMRCGKHPVVQVSTTQPSGKSSTPLDCLTDLGMKVGDHSQCTLSSLLGKHRLGGNAGTAPGAKRTGPPRESAIEVRTHAGTKRAHHKGG